MSVQTKDKTRIQGVLAVLGSRTLRPFLIEGGDDVIEYLESTIDAEFEKHISAVKQSFIKISDDNFIRKLENTVFPLCGNCYSYINKAVLEGSFSYDEDYGGVFGNIVYAQIFNDEGESVEFQL
ncbi:hypothetical protein EUZ85_17025 [Hahella sp. KA22]|uniref:hypothetical protein n=1 Tax=Hahella sp. KA22 TaxID=1628392 RepID=UPI000FDD1A8A|nr:hypothetical protein [Hahella sp. KA22]AZZ92337.1 hypothetical protein ENC22_14455 [Hahella sp. KA22]QAY55709.1 hypothetical protein EUZ85_17025 [Hahella sp. KA22]